MPDRSPDQPGDPLPESGLGGASDSGAHRRHPASSPESAREGRSPSPEDAAGDVPIERRRHHDTGYQGPERRIARR
jgi:hypothetical protein